MKHLSILLIFAVIFTACKGDDKLVMRNSIGTVNKVMVVTKSSDWNGDIGKTIRNSFGKLMVGLPQPEPTLSVSQVAPNGFGSMMKVARNILIIGEGDREDFFVRRNVYAQPQTVIYVYGTDDISVQRMFEKHEQEIIETFQKADIRVTQNIFRKSQVDDSKYKTLQNLGISLLIPSKFRTVDDTGEFLWLRNHLTSGIAKSGSNNILVYSIPLEDESKVAENIIAVRDSIGKKYIPGSKPETMYMITEEAYTPHIFNTEIDGKKAYEMRGKWEVKNDFMAGPFVNYSIIDKTNNRILVFEGFTYAPSVNKRAFLFELEAIGQSLKVK